MKHLAVLAFSMGALAASAQAQCVRTEALRLTAPLPHPGARFGDAVALEGNLLVVGAPSEPIPGWALAGAVHVFRFNGTTWIEEQVLSASDQGPADYDFGHSVAVSGNVIAVGAPGSSEGGLQPAIGALYMFRYDGAAWVEEQKLVPAEVNISDRFGHAVALSGNVVVGGAPYEDCGFSAGTCGAAYVYRYDGAAWQYEKELVPPAPLFVTDDGVGWSVDIDGDRILVGSPHPSSWLAQPGMALVYRDNGGAWDFETEITASDGQEQDEFGRSVALDGTDVLVGSARDDFGGLNNAGSAYLFEEQGGSFVEVGNPTGTGAATGDAFGAFVSLEDGVGLIGAPYAELAVSNGGAADLLRDSTAGWVRVSALVASDAAAADWLGSSTALEDGLAVVGAPQSDAAGPDAGAVYLYDVPELSLVASPASGSAFTPVTFATCGGLPGGLDALVLTELAGAPTVVPLLFDVFDSEGHSAFTVPVPPGLAGFTAELVSYGHYLPGVAGVSDPVTFTFL